MNGKILVSAGLLALSSAALAQVTTAPEPKLGNGQDTTANSDNAAMAPDNTADNVSDPGKR